MLTGLGIGLLSSIIPYSLEMEALRRIPPRVFGIWMSLEPAVAALVGLVLLGQALALREWLALPAAAETGIGIGNAETSAPDAASIVKNARRLIDAGNVGLSALTRIAPA